jgi:hypothetical protein
MLYNQTYNLDQVAFTADGLKDAQQTVRSLKLSSGSFVFVHNALVYWLNFVSLFFSDECDEGCEQRAQGNDEDGQD